MESFTIKFRLTTIEYSKIILIGLYRKAFFILATLVGLYLIVTIALDYSDVINFYSDTPYYEIICGLFLLFAPVLITLIATRQFISIPAFKNEIKYTFDETGMAIEGVTFKASFLWAHITKQKEIGKFLILYQSKRMGNFIDKTKLTFEQLQFIKSKVRRN